MLDSVQIRTSFAIVAALLLGCIAACTPVPKGLVIENVYFSPPEPYNGKTYIPIEGTLPDACTKIDGIDHSFEVDTVYVTMRTSRSQDVACSREATPFRETIRVETGDLYAGTYTVIVNGESFSFPMDFEFIVPETPDPGS
jgi:hypothetical protein